MADIAAFKPSARTIEIVNPGPMKSPIGLRWTIVSVDDERLERLKRAIADRQMYLQARGKHLKAEEVDENLNQLLFAASTAWEWYNPTGNEGDEGYDPDGQLTFHGEVPEFNRRNVLAVLKELPWVVDQLRKETSDVEAFFDGAKRN